MRETKHGLQNFRGSRFQKLLEAKKYRRLSKETYRIVKVNLYHNEPGLSPDPIVHHRMHPTKRSKICSDVLEVDQGMADQEVDQEVVD